MSAGHDLTWMREIGGSPVYTFKNPLIAASGIWTIILDQDQPDCARYLPFDFLLIDNTSNSNIDFYINASWSILVPANSIQKITDKPIWSFRVVELDGSAIAAGKISVSLMRSGMTSDRFAQKIAAKFRWLI